MADGENFTTKAPRHPVNDRLARWGLGGVMIFTAIAYSRCLRNGFVLDDRDQIVHNRYLGSWAFVWKSMVNDSAWFTNPSHTPVASYYRPFQNVWFALNYYLFRLNPIGWHAATIALHLIVVWLAFRVASELTDNRWTGLLAAGLFALLPIHAEAVVWAAAIAPLLSSAFALGAFDFYLQRRRAASLALFAGALLSYDSAAAFPALIAAHAFLLGASADLTPCPPSPPGKGERSSESSPLPLEGGVRGGVSLRATLSAAWPYFLELAGYLALRYWVLGFVSRQNPFNPRIYTWREILPQIPGVIARDLMLIAMPWKAGPSHPMRFAFGFAWPEFYLPAAGLVALCAIGWLVLRNHPHRRLYLFCAAWFLIALSPMLNLGALFVLGLIQDRYLYLPSFGLCLMAADLAATFGRTSEARASAVTTGATIVGIAYAVMLVHVDGFWHDEVAILSRCVQEVPDAVGCRTRLGESLAGRGDFAKARDQLEAAAALETGKPFWPKPSWDVFHNLGIVYAHFGQWPEAERAFAKALKLSAHPTAEDWLRLANAANRAGDSKQAQAALKQADAMRRRGGSH
ncbi:MAG: tetratricopeptide repeat protein [Candidatus Binataceae bacterium]